VSNVHGREALIGALAPALVGEQSAGDQMGGTAEEKARVVEGFMAYARPLQLPRRPCRASRGAVAVPQLGRDPSAAAARTHTGDRLILSARPLLLAGTQQVPRLVWERVDPLPGAG
jgi:hypothetical protein